MPRLSLAISLILGSLAFAQIVALIALMVVGESVPRAQVVLAQLSKLDWAALFGLQTLLAYSMWHLLRRRKKAVAWFTSYIGVGAWVAFLYSLSPSENPHFDELASLAGLLIALGVLAYMVRLKHQEFLR
jgi:hypothetical protein